MIHLDPARTAVVAVDMHAVTRPGRGDAALAAGALRPGDQARGRALRRPAARRRADRPRRHLVPRRRRDRRQPVLEAAHDDPSKARRGILRHNLAAARDGDHPELHDDGSSSCGQEALQRLAPTDLEFGLRRRLGIDTVILAGNTTTCVLCAAFEATNRDFGWWRADALDSMDGKRCTGRAEADRGRLGWPLTNDESSRGALGARFLRRRHARRLVVLVVAVVVRRPPPGAALRGPRRARSRSVCLVPQTGRWPPTART